MFRSSDVLIGIPDRHFHLRTAQYFSEKIKIKYDGAHNELKCGKKSILAGQYTVCLKG